MSETKKKDENMDRRTATKIIGGTIAGLVIGGAAGYLLKPEVPSVIQTTVTETVTSAPATSAASIIPAGAGGNPVKIFAVSGARFEVAYKAMKESFDKAYGDTLTVEGAAGDEVMFSRGPLELSSASPTYDMVNIPGENVAAYTKPGYLADLTNWVYSSDPNVGITDLDDYGVALLDLAAPYKGKFTYLPTDSNAHISYYRDDLLSAKGWTGANLPETWKDTLECIKEVHDPPTHYGYVGMFKPWYAGGKWLQQNRDFGGVEFNDKMEPQIDTDQGMDALEWLIELHKYGVPGELDFYDPDINEQLGSTGLAAGSYNEYGNGAAQNPTLSKFGSLIKNVPRVPLGANPYQNRRWSLMGGVAPVVNAASKHPLDAYLFVRWIQLKENMKAYCAGSGQPGRVSALKDPANQALDNCHHFAALAEAIHVDAFTKPKIPELADFDTTLGEDLHAALAGTSTPKAALQKAQSDIYALMKKAGYYG